MNVNVWGMILELLKLKMKTPQMYGNFHITFLMVTILVSVVLCMFFKNLSERGMRNFIFIVTSVVVLLEVYKQVIFSFSYTGGMIYFDYQWYSFPFQFCSTPMYVGLLASIVKKGRLQEALYSYLATFSVFAGLCVMLYPADVFVNEIGINIQTMVCHGSMMVIGFYLLATGHVKLEHKTILKAIPVFIVAVCMATVMNEIAYQSGLLETETFNMFFISPYCAPSLPVYSLVQGKVAFPWSLVIYIAGFTTAAYLILVLCMGVKHVVNTMFRVVEHVKFFSNRKFSKRKFLYK